VSPSDTDTEFVVSEADVAVPLIVTVSAVADPFLYKVRVQLLLVPGEDSRAMLSVLIVPLAGTGIRTLASVESWSPFTVKR
jgi:hypothetical protein